jgi:selenocysteine-specific elongation factor
MTTLGTAGHIDHGKTALVAALTGVDTDRLPEERERGMSIELGYAPLALPSARRLSVVDVPGHERFVHTMVAGATGVDLYLMTVAADDGVMPQTREHAAVLAALGVTRGVVAITKADRAAPEPAAASAAELLPGVETVACSARTGAGVAAVAAALDRVAAGLAALRAAGVAVRVGRDRYAYRDALAAVAARVTAIVDAEGAITLARLRDELDTSRKHAQALLEHLDAARVTKRLPDDSRVLRRRPVGERQ